MRRKSSTSGPGAFAVASRSAALLAILLLIAGCASVRSLQVDGRRRVYQLAGELSASSPRPLIIFLHGHGGTGPRMARLVHLDPRALEQDALVAYPTGTAWASIPWGSWNAGHCCGHAMERGVDDVGLLRALIDELHRSQQADPGRVAVAGVSNGAMMAYRLACDAADQVTAIAAVAGSMPPSCHPSRPVSVLIIHGTDDQMVPYAGGRNAQRDSRIDPSVQSAMSFWTTNNRCPALPKRRIDGRVEEERYAPCAEDTEVLLYTIRGGGHVWPGVQRDGPLDATAVVTEFFSRRRRLP